MVTVVSCDNDAVKRPAQGTVIQEARRRNTAYQIPDHILHNPTLNHLIATWLPANYNFEVHKTIWNITKGGYKRVALQLPEGLQRYAMQLCDLISTFAECQCTVMAEQTYGACCVDDMQAERLGCDYIVHYGHSCLIPVTDMLVKAMYVFVEIDFDHQHLFQVFTTHFTTDTQVALVGTIQFNSVLHRFHRELHAHGYKNVFVPQAKPLSSGEILGCTAPRLPTNTDCIVYIGDGRFHLESIMLSNPRVPAYRYDPYNRRMTIEGYDHAVMRQTRATAIDTARHATSFGIAVSTLGRQASTRIIHDLHAKLVAAGKSVRIVMMPEIKPQVLQCFEGVQAWVQVACPRLSIDWGYAFNKPLLSPFEMNVVLGVADIPSDHYPMDYYAYNPGGPWSNYHWLNSSSSSSSKK